MMETLSMDALEKIVLAEVERLTGSRVGYRVERIVDPPPGEANWRLIASPREGYTSLTNKALLPAVDRLAERYRLA